MTIIKIDGAYRAVMQINDGNMSGLYFGNGYTFIEAIKEAIDDYYKQLIPF